MRNACITKTQWELYDISVIINDNKKLQCYSKEYYCFIIFLCKV